ncbi:MAG: hypothetical protein CL678_17470 [Bdellovibrionaceae bacterium]|nr:hypothetical protein [Pseudobdellovibrionaceae bacterium]
MSKKSNVYQKDNKYFLVHPGAEDVEVDAQNVLDSQVALLEYAKHAMVTDYYCKSFEKNKGFLMTAIKINNSNLLFLNNTSFATNEEHHMFIQKLLELKLLSDENIKKFATELILRNMPLTLLFNHLQTDRLCTVKNNKNPKNCKLTFLPVTIESSMFGEMSATTKMIAPYDTVETKVCGQFILKKKIPSYPIFKFQGCNDTNLKLFKHGARIKLFYYDQTDSTSKSYSGIVLITSLTKNRVFIALNDNSVSLDVDPNCLYFIYTLCNQIGVSNYKLFENLIGGENKLIGRCLEETTRTLNFPVASIASDEIKSDEIYRLTLHNKIPEKELIGFKSDSSFSETNYELSAMYKVTGQNDSKQTFVAMAVYKKYVFRAEMIILTPTFLQDATHFHCELQPNVIWNNASRLDIGIPDKDIYTVHNVTQVSYNQVLVKIKNEADNLGYDISCRLMSNVPDLDDSHSTDALAVSFDLSKQIFDVAGDLKNQFQLFKKLFSNENDIKHVVFLSEQGRSIYMSVSEMFTLNYTGLIPDLTTPGGIFEYVEKFISCYQAVLNEVSSLHDYAKADVETHVDKFLDILPIYKEVLKTRGATHMYQILKNNSFSKIERVISIELKKEKTFKLKLNKKGKQCSKFITKWFESTTRIDINDGTNTTPLDFVWCSPFKYLSSETPLSNTAKYFSSLTGADVTKVALVMFQHSKASDKSPYMYISFDQSTVPDNFNSSTISLMCLCKTSQTNTYEFLSHADCYLKSSLYSFYPMDVSQMCLLHNINKFGIKTPWNPQNVYPQKNNRDLCSQPTKKFDVSDCFAAYSQVNSTLPSSSVLVVGNQLTNFLLECNLKEIQLHSCYNLIANKSICIHKSIVCFDKESENIFTSIITSALPIIATYPAVVFPYNPLVKISTAVQKAFLSTLWTMLNQFSKAEDWECTNIILQVPQQYYLHIVTQMNEIEDEWTSETFYGTDKPKPRTKFNMKVSKGNKYISNFLCTFKGKDKKIYALYIQNASPTKLRTSVKSNIKPYLALQSKEPDKYTAKIYDSKDNSIVLLTYKKSSTKFDRAIISIPSLVFETSVEYILSPYESSELAPNEALYKKYITYLEPSIVGTNIIDYIITNRVNIKTGQYRLSDNNFDASFSSTLLGKLSYTMDDFKLEDGAAAVNHIIDETKPTDKLRLGTRGESNRSIKFFLDNLGHPQSGLKFTPENCASITAAMKQNKIKFLRCYLRGGHELRCTKPALLEAWCRKVGRPFTVSLAPYGLVVACAIINGKLVVASRQNLDSNYLKLNTDADKLRDTVHYVDSRAQIQFKFKSCKTDDANYHTIVLSDEGDVLDCELPTNVQQGYILSSFCLDSAAEQRIYAGLPWQILNPSVKGFKKRPYKFKDTTAKALHDYLTNKIKEIPSSTELIPTFAVGSVRYWLFVMFCILSNQMNLLQMDYKLWPANISKSFLKSKYSKIGIKVSIFFFKRADGKRNKIFGLKVEKPEKTFLCFTDVTKPDIEQFTIANDPTDKILFDGNEKIVGEHKFIKAT